MDSTVLERAKKGVHSTAALPEILETKTLAIPGMTSERGVKKIEQAFLRHRGVKKVHIDKESAVMTITFDKRETNVPELHELLLETGYHPPATLAGV